jgi:hypothetical protein
MIFKPSYEHSVFLFPEERAVFARIHPDYSIAERWEIVRLRALRSGAANLQTHLTH